MAENEFIDAEGNVSLRRVFERSIHSAKEGTLYTLALYPTVAEIHDLTCLLKLRLAATHTAGLAYIAKNLAISTNLVAKPKPDNVLFDICLITQTKPTVILSVVKDPNADLTASRRYNLSLAKAVTDTIRRFTDEQFCSMYGLINESTLADQRSFDEALLKIKDEVSRICVPDSLSMSIQKYEKVRQAFLMSMAVTRFVTDETGEISKALWLLTFDQFCFLTENIDRNEVHVPAKYHSGIHVLMREVASRLEKGASTLLLHSSNENVELARRMSVCSYTCDLDEFQQDRNKQIHVPLNVDNIVTDCTQRDIAPLMTHNPNIWYFEDEETDSLKQEELDVHKMRILTNGVLYVVAIIGGLILDTVTEKASLTYALVRGVVSKFLGVKDTVKDTDLNGKKQKVEQEAVRTINASYSSCTKKTSLDGKSDGFSAAANGVTKK
ncbi:uncharacterized protein [Haliotis cracherodii]|uniref:uncharacterized protein n=1 Tax=Haliotis cracherodii TaxID=6455 RepID=UPI0039EB49FE